MEWQHVIGTPDTPFVHGSKLTYYYHFPDRWQSGAGLTVRSFVIHKCWQSIALNSIFVFSNWYYRIKNCGRKCVRLYVKS
jgi:hypothetical protein